MLLIAFTALCVFTYQRLYNESHDAMRRALDREGGKTPPKSEIGGKPFSPPGALTPVFCVLVGADGAVRTVTEDTAVDMSEETLAQAVSLALEGDRDEGVLNALNLRYLLRETAAGTKIAFADRSGEIRSMLSLVITSLLVGLRRADGVFLHQPVSVKLGAAAGQTGLGAAAAVCGRRVP